MQFIRSTLFTIGFLLGVILIGLLTALVLRWLAYPNRAPTILLWNRWAMWLAKVVCGVHWQVIGCENISTEPAVYLSNHESEGETIFLQLLLRPVSTVLKQELLGIPFFGLGLKLMDPIAINRASPKTAMKDMLNTGVARINQDRNVLVYPQGSRIPYPKPLKYARGGAAIAVAAQVPVIPIAHNTSSCWPTKGFNLSPGTITVVIGEAIPTQGRSAKEISNDVQTWAQQQLEQLHQV